MLLPYSQICADVVAIVARALHISADRILPESKLKADFGVEFFSLWEITTELEHHFEIIVPVRDFFLKSQKDIPELLTVKIICDYVSNRLTHLDSLAEKQSVS